MSMLNIAFTITTAPLLPAHLAKDDVLAVEVVGARRRDEELPQKTALQLSAHGLR